MKDKLRYSGEIVVRSLSGHSSTGRWKTATKQDREFQTAHQLLGFWSRVQFSYMTGERYICEERMPDTQRFILRTHQSCSTSMVHALVHSSEIFRNDLLSELTRLGPAETISVRCQWVSALNPWHKYNLQRWILTQNLSQDDGDLVGAATRTLPPSTWLTY